MAPGEGVELKVHPYCVDYVRQQFLIAEPWLNIISNSNPYVAAIENEKNESHAAAD